MDQLHLAIITLLAVPLLIFGALWSNWPIRFMRFPRLRAGLAILSLILVFPGLIGLTIMERSEVLHSNGLLIVYAWVGCIDLAGYLLLYPSTEKDGKTYLGLALLGSVIIGMTLYLTVVTAFLLGVILIVVGLFILTFGSTIGGYSVTGAYRRDPRETAWVATMKEYGGYTSLLIVVIGFACVAGGACILGGIVNRYF